MGVKTARAAKATKISLRKLAVEPLSGSRCLAPPVSFSKVENMSESVGFDEWCLLEVMGHNRYAGRVTEQSIGGASLIRIDIPKTKRQPAFSKLFNASSIYAITPVMEEVAKSLAEKINDAPVSVYDLPEEVYAKIRQSASTALPAHPLDCDDDDEEEVW